MGKLLKIKTIHSEDVYDITVQDNHNFVANDVVVHNCVEIRFYPTMETIDSLGLPSIKTGWQGCNLTEGNGAACNTEDKFYSACIALAVLGTLQAGYTDFKYIDVTSKELFEREALLGCSFTGWMANPHIMMNPEIQRKGAELIKQINIELANIIGISPAARLTTVKPSGNASVLLKSPSGCHGDHSPRYFRVMQINKQSEMGKYLAEKHPYLLEESVWSANNSDYVAYIPIIANKNAKFKHELLGINQLDVVRTIQNNWIQYGVNDEVNVRPWLRHSVSNTVELNYDDYDNVCDYLYDNRYDFAATSFLPHTGDKDYRQAPFTSVLSSTDLFEKYGDAALFASGLIVDGLQVFDNDLWSACDMVKKRDLKLVGTRTQVLLQKDWIRRAKQFARRFMKNDIDNMIVCLKDVYLYHKWVSISRELKNKEFNFQQELGMPSYIDIDTMGAMACSAGQCELPTEYLDKLNATNS